VSEPISRRDAVKGLTLAGCAWAGLIPAQKATAASNLPHLSAATDPTAAALHYVDNADAVDRAQAPTYQPGHTCATCLHLKGTVGDPWRPCETYPGKLVSVGGWCQLWVKKS
jgi:hypothetical protein